MRRAEAQQFGECHTFGQALGEPSGALVCRCDYNFVGGFLEVALQLHTTRPEHGSVSDTQ